MSALDTILTDVAKVARIIEPILAFVAVAQSATGVGGHSAETVLKVIDAAIKSLESAASGAITHDQAMAELARLKAGLVGNDAAADAALAAKFP